ncbi:MAG TPA: hypothetical protein VGL42_10040 [Opitutaceae bacterium]
MPLLPRSIFSFAILGISVVAPFARGQGYSITELGTFSGGADLAGPINASGEVAAAGYLADRFTYNAFLYNGSSLMNLGTLGGTDSRSVAINATGEVAGVSTLSSGASHAFLYNGSHMLDLGAFGGSGASSLATAINASGEVAGSSGSDVFLYNGSTLLNLGSFGSFTSATAMNDSGEVVGESGPNVNESHAFLYDGSSLIDLGTLAGGAGRSFATGINANGQVTGTSTAAHGSHAFLYSGGVMTDLGSFAGNQSNGEAINSSGEVAGWSLTGNGEQVAFLYNGSKMQDLGDLGGMANVTGLNDSGVVIGYSAFDRGAEDDAFVYRSGKLWDLNDFLPVNSGIHLSTAASINDAGQILATGFDSNLDISTDFILTPNQDLPDRASSFGLLGGALALLALAAQFRGAHVRGRENA